MHITAALQPGAFPRRQISQRRSGSSIIAIHAAEKFSFHPEEIRIEFAKGSHPSSYSFPSNAGAKGFPRFINHGSKRIL